MIYVQSGIQLDDKISHFSERHAVQHELFITGIFHLGFFETQLTVGNGNTEPSESKIVVKGRTVILFLCRKAPQS